MICGFTGTRKGMTEHQRLVVRELMFELDVRVLHLGDCVGADAEAHQIAAAAKVHTIGHPPIVTRFRAYCQYDEWRPPREYLLRNHDIVDEGVDGLIATPRDAMDRIRSGTWATVRYARKIGRRVWLINPDGTVTDGTVTP